jgi:hypothetical protein
MNRAYRLVTKDGFILGYRPNRKDANEMAQQQARQLGETIVIKHRNSDGEYIKIAQINK